MRQRLPSAAYSRPVRQEQAVDLHRCRGPPAAVSCRGRPPGACLTPDTVAFADRLKQTVLRDFGPPSRQAPGTNYPLNVNIDPHKRPLFVGADGERITRGTLQYRVLRAFRRAGIRHQPDPRALVHGLRHTFATELANADANVYTLMNLPGHESISTSQRYVTTAGRETRVAAGQIPSTASGQSGSRQPAKNAVVRRRQQCSNCSFSVSMSIPASLSCTDRRVSHNVHAGCSHACVQFQARAAIAVEDGIVVRHAHAGPGILAPAVHCFVLPRSFRPLSWLLGAYAISEAIPEDQASAALSTLAATSMPSIRPSSVCPCSMLTIMSGSTS